MSAINSLRHALESFGVPARNFGNVVVIPGILGSDLTASVAGVTERVWPILPRVDALLLDADGESEAQHGRVVQPTNINHIYISLVQTLELFWNVLPFAYDWRLSIAKTSQRLAQVVQAQFHGEPFHMVAHSMGGLIARAMLREHPEIQRGGRLAMLGVPNYGAVLAEAALESAQKAAVFLQIAGGPVAPATALAAIRSWPSVYELLPSLSRDPESQSFYSQPPPGLSIAHLARAEQLHQELDATPGDASMVYIGGTNVPTLDRPLITLQGDGVVSHRLGFMDGVKTFTLFSDHVSLPSHPRVFGSITPLLRDGSPGFLL